MVDVNKDGQLNGRAVVEADFQGTSPPTFETAAHSKPPVPVTVLSAEDAYARVVAQAGPVSIGMQSSCDLSANSPRSEPRGRSSPTKAMWAVNQP